MAEEPETPARRGGPRVPGQGVNCGWCGKAVAIPARGRVPKWCSDSCRHRAWEQRRAAASGLAAVEVLERRVEVVPDPSPRSPSDWAELLAELAQRLDSGRIYERDLPVLSDSVLAVVQAFNRRVHGHRTSGRLDR